MVMESTIIQREKQPEKEWVNDFSGMPMINQQILKMENEATRLSSELRQKEFNALQNFSLGFIAKTF